VCVVFQNNSERSEAYSTHKKGFLSGAKISESENLKTDSEIKKTDSETLEIKYKKIKH
jgi:hypothetical protein